VAEAIVAVLLRFTDPQVARSSKFASSAGLAEMVEVFLDGIRPRAPLSARASGA
jgi:hypothetical protein